MTKEHRSQQRCPSRTAANLQNGSAQLELSVPHPGRAILRSLVTERAGWLIDQLRDTTGFLYEIGLLKRYKRTGWSLAGVPSPESVADHSFRASVIASVMAAMEGADPQRAAFLALWHDSQETRTTDIPHLTKNYVSVARNEQVTQGQVAPLPPAAASMISAAVAEYEAGETLEARCARDAEQSQLAGTRQASGCGQ